jgi:hypothetical protein
MIESHPQPPSIYTLTCPRCHQHTGVARLNDVRYGEDIPEGLARGVTAAECAECGYEWEMVTHRQIVQSLPTWTHMQPHFR